MSTKISIFYTDSMHVYRESYDDETIYVKINNEKFRVELEMSMAEFAKIASSINIESLRKQANLSDEIIKKFVTEKVKTRTFDCATSLFGSGIYGPNTLSEEIQIENGFNFYVKKRNTLKQMLDIVDSKFVHNVSFGLEDIIADKTKE